MFNRLKNLWKLSEYQPTDYNKGLPINLPDRSVVSHIVKYPDNIVEIIKKKEDPIEKITNDN